MNADIQDYMNKYSSDIQSLFVELRELIIRNVPKEINEKLWAKFPSYYIEEKVIRIIPFKDHINVEAEAVLEHKNQLEQYQITPKGMLQIYLNQDIPENVLKEIFYDTLIG